MIGSAVSDPPPILVAHLRRALQQTRVEIKNVSGIRFAARRTAQQQRNFAIRRRVLRKIVVDHQRMPLGVAEIFAHGGRGVGRDVLHRRGFGGRRRDHDGVLHRAGIFENLHHLRDRRTLLPDRVVNTNQVVALAVDDGVERDGGLAGLAVADDQLALAAANRNHAVDGLQPSRHRLAHRLAVNHAGSNALQRDELSLAMGPLSSIGCRRASSPRGRSWPRPRARS